MKEKLDHQATLFRYLKSGATVITPNNRLSQQLLDTYIIVNSNSILNTPISIPKPRCMPYLHFLQEAYQNARLNNPLFNFPILLTAAQQSLLWRKILPTPTLLCDVEEAWSRCQLWQVNHHNPLFGLTPQTQKFQQWRDRFQQQLKQLHAITLEQVVEFLFTLPHPFSITDQTAEHQDLLIWACFDDFSPQQRYLQEQLTQLGYTHLHFDLPAQPPSAYQFPATDQTQEWHTLIQWIHWRRLQGDQRIGIIVPHLEGHSKTLHRHLHRHFSAEHINFSLGKPLSSYPLVSHALHCLRLETASLSQPMMRLVLQSPFLAGALHEWQARQHMLFSEERFTETSSNIYQFISKIQATCPRLAHNLRTITDYPQEDSSSHWSHHFKTRLQQLGFPGDQALNSTQYQCLQRLLRLFDDYMQLNFIAPLFNHAEALAVLTDLAAATTFQPQTPNTAPIQVLGLLEASGCTFDSIWVLGLTAQCLPQKTALSPFIPPSLQRDLKMPRATPEREIYYAESTLSRLQRGSNFSVFSYPMLQGDTHQLPTPLLHHLPILDQSMLKHDVSLPVQSLIAYTETYHLPLVEKEKIKGGAALLSSQAKCPFRAFATHRLHAHSVINDEALESLKNRGKLLHRILEALWSKLNNQEALLRMTPEDRRQLIYNSIQSLLPPMPVCLQEVEALRLQRLLQSALEWEINRPSFDVAGLEEQQTITLAGLEFKLRLDRLDHLDDNNLCVIDYKTTLPQPPWYDERPEETQLLLYALLNENIKTILFLELKAGRVTCCGISEDLTTIPGVTTLKSNHSWVSLKQHWQQQLNRLAEEFSAGWCAPQPRQPSTCQTCAFPSLCRIPLTL